MLDNLYRNPGRNYCIWDGILYEMARQRAEHRRCCMNCSVLRLRRWTARALSTGARLADDHADSFTRFIAANCFADCSGDSVLAPLTGRGVARGPRGARRV